MRSSTNFFHQRRCGFTLLELMISIAITGILTAMVFTNFSQEKERNALKNAINQIQTDLQAAQASAQGGVLYNGAVQLGYGVSLTTNGTSHTTYRIDTVNSRPTVLTRTYATNGGVQIVAISGLQSPHTTMNIDYAVPSGNASLTDGPASTTITLKNTKLNICYAITVTSYVGTVSQRRLTSCP
jgi:prepilin-type N-terminal cleavage/methylation domain-containing protein